MTGGRGAYGFRKKNLNIKKIFKLIIYNKE